MIHIFISFLWSGLNEAHCTNEDMKVVMQACFFVLAWWELCWETGNEGESWGLTCKCSHKQTKNNFFNKKTKLFIIIAPGLFIFLFWGQRIISENWSYVFISWLVCLIYCAHFRFCFLLVGLCAGPQFTHCLNQLYMIFSAGWTVGCGAAVEMTTLETTTPSRWCHTDPKVEKTFWSMSFWIIESTCT